MFVISRILLNRGSVPYNFIVILAGLKKIFIVEVIIEVRSIEVAP